MPPTQKEQIAALQNQIRVLKEEHEGFRAQLVAAEQLRLDTHNMVAEMYGALMKPQLGQGDKTMVERIADVVVDIESGRRTSDNLIAIARRLVAIAAFVAAIAAFLKLGVWLKE